MKKVSILFSHITLGLSLAAAPAHADHHEPHAAHLGPHAAHPEHESEGKHLPGYEMAENEVAADANGHGAHDAHHVPHFSDINWWHGLIGEKEGVAPSLLWRAPGTPIPLGALLLNTAILFFLIGRFGAPGVRQGLVDRKRRIAGDIERAAEMRKEAEGQLAHYEEKLEQMEAEMSRIKQEMREQAELDRKRALEDAQARRLLIEQESKTLIAHELSQARYDATMKAVSGAVNAAREEVKKSLSQQDHERLAQEFLGGLQARMKKSKGVAS
jgi:F-type H+-transporting ATPase subunit b